ncbi:uncharacterized protein LOC129759163 [Uranotaenia lowii]|uniref:uncharacterized protein LOC129759163 n=1 Tax=Uranotaenia lowii TaxID=190385 RepID=UPI00247A9F93|nr:uncharacterized protein LOC129759163 [Uranotaenia lowii]
MPEKVDNNNCVLCEDTDSADDMVQCDGCSFWSHYVCAGVTEAIASLPWKCAKCSNELQVPKIRKPVKKTASKRNGSTKSEVCTDAGKSQSTGSIQESLSALEKETAAIEQQLLEERKLHQKRMEFQRTVIAKKREWQQKQLDEKLLLEKQQLENELADHKEFLVRQKSMREQFQQMKAELSQEYADESEDESDPDTASGKTERWVDAHRDVRGAFPKKLATGEISMDTIFCQRGNKQNDDLKKHDLFPEQRQQVNSSLLPEQGPPRMASRMVSGIYPEENAAEFSPYFHELEERFDLTANERSVIRNILERRDRTDPEVHLRTLNAMGPTKEQLAARQAASKHLPVFRGEPEVWPFFISCYETTTAACGFTNTDNLKRLQDSLQGLAKEAVQSRLLLPESVPEAIEDLRQLFGNPEKILKSLLAKVRKAQAPRTDRLETFLYFGIAVKQLCDHLEAAKLHDHMSNPMLVGELVNKLPSDYQLSWVRYKKRNVGTPLRMFTNFMNEIVAEVSEVADFEGERSSSRVSNDVGRNKHKKKEHVNAHDAKVAAATQSYVVPRTRKSCPMCKRTDHKLRFCDDFSSLPLAERRKLVDRLKLCLICLSDHGKVKCTFKGKCNVANCKASHHSLLHCIEETVHHAVAECNVHFKVSRTVIFA